MPPTTQRKPNLALRATIIQAIRNFFGEKGFLEVETPIRIPAPIPEAHIGPVRSENWFLQASPEISMKRLLARGYDRIFQISKCFRKQERGNRHLPEFTLLEWYCAHKDYEFLMRQTTQLVRFVARHIHACGMPTAKGLAADIGKTWDRLTVAAAFGKYTDTTAQEALAQGSFDELMGIRIEPNLGVKRPLFLTDYPVECGSLARKKAEDPTVVERFELYVAGLELCNGFSELTCAGEQRKRFRKEQHQARMAGKKPAPLPEKFLADLAKMPPAAGNALGIDRLVMLFAGCKAIDAVVAFTPEEL